VTEAGWALRALADGSRFAVQYNPLFAIGAAATAAALYGYPKAPRDRLWWSVSVLGVGWLLGDGLRVLARARDVYDGIAVPALADGPAWAGWAVIGTWAIGTLLIGYALPAGVGAKVGRRVTHGTGWLSAAAVAGGLSLALSTIVGALS
jgi:hypothetical protein